MEGLALPWTQSITSPLDKLTQEKQGPFYLSSAKIHIKVAVRINELTREITQFTVCQLGDNQFSSFLLALILIYFEVQSYVYPCYKTAKIL